MPARRQAASLLSQLVLRSSSGQALCFQSWTAGAGQRALLRNTPSGQGVASSSSSSAARRWAGKEVNIHGLAASDKHRQLASQFTFALRSMATSLAGVEPAVVAKARRMSVWVGGMAGLFGSFVGVGGGVLIGPIIANACQRLPQRVISGTSLAAVVAVGTTSGIVFWQSGFIDFTSALVIASTAVLGSPLGARATSLFNCTKLRSMLGYWLYFVSPLVPLKSFIFSQMEAQADVVPLEGSTSSTAAAAGEDAAPGENQPALLRSLNNGDVVLAAVGGIAGFASGLLGIGGGTIVTPLLALVTGMPQTSVVGTSLAAMAVPAVAGLTQHARMGNVDWVMAMGLVGGSFAGALLGSHVAIDAPPLALEFAFAFGMAYLGHKTLKLTKPK